MELAVWKKKILSRKTLLLAAASLGAGLCNGLLGTGGGMILIFALAALGVGKDEKEVFVLSSLGVLTFSAVSALFYAAKGQFDTSALARFLPGAVLGGFLGARLIRLIHADLLRMLFGLLLVFGGARMLGVV